MSIGSYFRELIINYWGPPTKGEISLAYDSLIIEVNVTGVYMQGGCDPIRGGGNTKERTVTKVGPKGQVSDSHTNWGFGEAFQTEERVERLN